MREVKRVSKNITDKEDIDYLLNVKFEDITTTFMMNTFGKFKGKSRFNPYDIIKIAKNSYGPEGKKNKNEFTTTVGLWIYNKFFIEDILFDEFHYINDTLTKKTFNKINSKLSYGVLEDRVSLETLREYLNRTQKMMPFVNILCPGFSEKLITCTTAINKKKKEIYPKYKERIEAGDVVAVEEMEKELKDYARLYLDGDPGMDSFDSGASPSFDNHFKNMFIMKGAMKDPDPDKGYNVLMSNLMDGVSAEEYPVLSNALAAGPYARAKKTADGGFWEKEFLQAFQHVLLGKPGSDCGSKVYKKVLLDNNNISDWMYSYMAEGSRLVELNSTNMDKYIGKEVKFRFSLFCKNRSTTGCYCNACVGNLPYKLNTNNIGMMTAVIPSTLKLISMKSFHDSVVKTRDMDLYKVFGLK